MWLIPKPFVKTKIMVNEWMTLKDLFTAIFLITLSFLPLLLPLPLPFWLTFLIGILGSLVSLVLMLPMFPGKQPGYSFLFKGLLYLIDVQKFHTTSGTKPSRLFPFKVEDDFIVGRGTYTKIIRATGRDFHSLSYGVQNKKVRELQTLFASVSSDIQIMKMNRRQDYKRHISAMIDGVSGSLQSFFRNQMHRIPKKSQDEIKKLLDGELDFKKIDVWLFQNESLFKPEEINSLLTQVTLAKKNIETVLDSDTFANYQTFYFLTITSVSKKQLHEEYDILFNTLESLEHTPTNVRGNHIYSFLSSIWTKNNVKMSETKDIRLKNVIPKRIKFKPTYYIQTIRSKVWSKSKQRYVRKMKDKYCRVYTIDVLPTEVHTGWLDQFLHLTPHLSIVKTKDMSMSIVLEQLRKKTRMERSTLLTVKDENMKIRLRNNILALEQIMEDVNRGQPMQKVVIYFTIIEDSLNALRYEERNLKKRMKLMRGAYLNGMVFAQKEGYSSIVLPSTNTKHFNHNYQNIPLTTFAAGYPFTSDLFQDPGAPLLGYNINNSPVNLDFTFRSNHRVNGHFALLGKSGKGKSTGLAKIAKDLVSQGIKTIMIDYDNEYTKLANALDGVTIDMGASSVKKLNILQFFGEEKKLDKLVDDVDIESQVEHLPQHLTSISQFLAIAADIPQTSADLIGDYVANLFKKYKITEKNLYHKKNKEWPLLSELIDSVVSDYTKLAKKKTESLHIEELRVLAKRLDSLKKNQTKMLLWNNKTNFEFNDVNITIFNMNALKRNPDQSIVRAQTKLVLSYVDGKASENWNNNQLPLEKYRHKQSLIERELNILQQLEKPDEKKITNKIQELKELEKGRALAELNWEKHSWGALLIDEAHLLLDDNHPEGMYTLAKFIKRFRKNQFIIGLSTQEISEFKREGPFKKEAAAIINNLQYMFVFGLKENAINDFNEILETGAENSGLTEQEKELLSTAPRGQMLAFMTTDLRMPINIVLTDYEYELITGSKRKEASYD